MATSRHHRQFITWLALIVFLLLALTAWAILSRSPTQTDQAWQRVQSEGRLRVGMDPSYPPFEIINEDTKEVEGYDADLAEEIGRRLGVQVEFVHIGFDSLYDAVITGKIDAIISGMPYDPNWTEDVAYGQWYFNAGQFLAVRQDETQIASVGNLANHCLGVELGTTGDLEARRLQRQIDGLTFKTFPTADAALQALVNREVDAALVDAISAYLFISQGGKVKLLTDAVSDESYAVVTNRKSSQLRAAIDTVILEMREDGFLESLRNKWLLRQAF